MSDNMLPLHPETAAFAQRKASTDWDQVLTELGLDAMSRKQRQNFVDDFAWFESFRSEWTTEGYSKVLSKLVDDAKKAVADEATRAKRFKVAIAVGTLVLMVVGILSSLFGSVIANTIHPQPTAQSVTVKLPGGTKLPTTSP